MRCNPFHAKAHGPKCGPVGNVDIRNCQNRIDDLRADAVQPEVDDAKPEGDSEREVPHPGRGFRALRFGCSQHIHIRTPAGMIDSRFARRIRRLERIPKRGRVLPRGLFGFEAISSLSDCTRAPSFRLCSGERVGYPRPVPGMTYFLFPGIMASIRAINPGLCAGGWPTALGCTASAGFAAPALAVGPVRFITSA
jgi:hypothetical protein